jgi:hypothetical protein
MAIEALDLIRENRAQTFTGNDDLERIVLDLCCQQTIRLVFAF